MSELLDRPIKKREDLELLQFVLADDMARSLKQIEKSQKREEFEGKLDTRTLEATDKRKFIRLVRDWPYKPWAKAYFWNDGPNNVKIAVNDPYEEQLLKADDHMDLDYLKANRRIEMLYYWCAPDETASVRVLGKW